MSGLRPILVAATAWCACGCATRDPCIEAHQRFVDSPSGSRRISIFTGPCPGAAPQVLIEFDRRGGAGVFAVNDTVATLRGRWVSEDTAEVTYPSNASVVKQETQAQLGDQRVIIRYVQADSRH